MKAYVILNPTAGGGRGDRLRATVAGQVAARLAGADVVLAVTSAPGDATRSARDAVRDGASLVIAVGGDGTIQEVVNGLLGPDPAVDGRCELGIVCCGTGRGLAMSLGLPKALDEQLDLLTGSGTACLDVGRARSTTADGTTRERYFVNECQAGVGGAVAAAVGMGRKRLGGKLAFGLASVVELVKFRCPRVRIRLDDGPEFEEQVLGVMAGNGEVCAGGMRLTPGAQPDDGILDVVVVRSMTVPVRLRVFPRIYRGDHTGDPHVSSHRCRSLTLDADEPVAFEADGEVLGFTPCRVDVVPRALRVRGVCREAR